jgi:putative hydrolase of the HAD superfamily
VSPTRAVLLDLDDTLFDHHHSAASAIEALRQRRPRWKRHTAEALLAEHRRLLEETHVRVLAGALTGAEARRVRMRGLFAFAGEDVEDAGLEEAVELNRQAYQAARRPVPGALALLRALRARGVPAVVVTNNLTAEQREKLRVCGLDGLVDALVVSEEVGVQKPDPRIFELALARAGCGPAEAAMLGDAWAVDVEGARAAGIGTIVWLNRAGLPCPEPAWVREVRSLEPTPELLERLGVERKT